MTPATAPEPLVLTLEEVMVLLAGQDLGLVYRADIEADPFEAWLVVDKATGVNAGWGMTWMEAAAKMFGRPVVARDEAAELRTELDEFRTAIKDYITARTAAFIFPTAATTNEAFEVYVAASLRLRRLAGEEEREP